MDRSRLLPLLNLILFGFIAFIIVANADAISTNMMMNRYAADIENSEWLKALADEKLNATCIENNVTADHCAHLLKETIYLFALENISLREDNLIEGHLLLNNRPEDTLKYGGDCENQAILSLSMLKSEGVQNLYLVVQDHHACWMADGEFFNCAPGEPVKAVKWVG